MLTALIFIIAIAFEIVGVLAYMVGAIALWAIATCELAELHVWAPYWVGFTKRKMAIEAIEIAAGGFTLFLFGLYVITRIIAA